MLWQRRTDRRTDRRACVYKHSPWIGRFLKTNNDSWHSKWTNPIVIFSSLLSNNWYQQKEGQVRISSLKKGKRSTVKLFEMFFHVCFCWEHGGALITLRPLLIPCAPHHALKAPDECWRALSTPGIYGPHHVLKPPHLGKFLHTERIKFSHTLTCGICSPSCAWMSFHTYYMCVVPCRKREPHSQFLCVWVWVLAV